MNEEFFILDATAGYRMMWFNKRHPNTIYFDERPECKPDIIGDFCNLPFPNEAFKHVVFDPPHYISGWHNPKIKLNLDYGLLKAETWPSDLMRAFKELWRVLKPHGVLLFKWNDYDISFERVLRLFPIKPLFGQQVKTGRSAKHPQATKWFCFIKI